MKICTKCNSQNPKDGIFCINCGERLEISPPQQPQNVEPKKTSKMIIIIPSIIAIVCVVILIIFFLLAVNSVTDPEIPESLIGYWDFDDVNEGVTYDLSGNEHHGIIHGARTVGGISGDALFFDGYGDYVEISKIEDFYFKNQDITFSAWIQIIDNTDDYRQFIVLGDSYSISPVFLLGKIRSGASDGKLYTHLQSSKDETCAVNCIDYSGSTLPKNEWIHVASVLDYPNDIKFYVNGKLQGSSPIIDFDFSKAENLKLYIGAWPWSGGIPPYEYHYGQIDEVKIYTKALSSNEIISLFNEFN